MKPRSCLFFFLIWLLAVPKIISHVYWSLMFLLLRTFSFKLSTIEILRLLPSISMYSLYIKHNTTLSCHKSLAIFIYV